MFNLFNFTTKRIVSKLKKKERKKSIAKKNIPEKSPAVNKWLKFSHLTIY